MRAGSGHIFWEKGELRTKIKMSAALDQPVSSALTSHVLSEGGKGSNRAWKPRTVDSLPVQAGAPHQAILSFSHSFPFFLFLFFRGKCPIPGDVQELFLDLSSGITPGGTGGTMWNAEDQDSCVQSKCSTHCTISLALIFLSLLILSL